MQEFYDVKLKRKVQIPTAQCTKTTYTKGSSTRYALKSKSPESGVNLTKFIKKELYDSLDIPVS